MFEWFTKKRKIAQLTRTIANHETIDRNNRAENTRLRDKVRTLEAALAKKAEKPVDTSSAGKTPATTTIVKAPPSHVTGLQRVTRTTERTTHGSGSRQSSDDRPSQSSDDFLTGALIGAAVSHLYSESSSSSSSSCSNDSSSSSSSSYDSGGGGDFGGGGASSSWD